MTDLRDKIAQTIYANLREHFKPWTDTRAIFHFWAKDLDAEPDEVPHSVSHNLQVIAAHLADAVIRELGLKQEPHRPRCGRDDCNRHRYVTEWEQA